MQVVNPNWNNLRCNIFVFWLQSQNETIWNANKHNERKYGNKTNTDIIFFWNFRRMKGENKKRKQKCMLGPKWFKLMVFLFSFLNASSKQWSKHGMQEIKKKIICLFILIFVCTIQTRNKYGMQSFLLF